MTVSEVTIGVEEIVPVIPYADAADDDSRALLQRAATMLGVVPNAGRTYLHRPDILRLIDLMNYTIVASDQSNLDIGMKNKLGVICSSINNCVYCTTHQCSVAQRPKGETGEKWELTDDEVLALISGSDQGSNDVERLCFEFARTASRRASDVNVELLERMKERMTAAQIVELGCVVSMWKFFNTMHDSLHIPSEATLAKYWGFIATGRALEDQERAEAE